MSVQAVRIGLVGAGGNFRERHGPGFRALDRVELVSVCNRSRESSERAAAEFGISTVYDNWLELVESDDTDAICIGTWPNMHCAITLAALESEKHVLAEARLAMNAEEAHAMLEASRMTPHLVTQVVPYPGTFWVDGTIRELVADGYLGDVLAVEMRITQDSFVDLERLLHWRQDVELSGYNILNMGMLYESLLRWIGPATKVMAMTKTVTTQRKDEQGYVRAVVVPDHVDIICLMACGAQANMRFSAVTGLAPTSQVWLHGSHGTLHVDLDTRTLWGGRRGDQQLKEIEIQPAKRGAWRVEEEFVNAIRGIEPVTHNTFETGVKYMDFTEAVTRSAQSGEVIPLPL